MITLIMIAGVDRFYSLGKKKSSIFPALRAPLKRPFKVTGEVNRTSQKPVLPSVTPAAQPGKFFPSDEC